ncbi:MAG: response regulator transcription factor, partial [Armatimonadetes bacterium]|nr:response regulator transcription factor [Armatimonadota bacterium]
GAQSVRATIIDDQLVFRMGLRLYLTEAMPEVQVVGEAESVAAGVSLAEREAPDLILMDGFLGDARVDEALGELREKRPDCRIVILANYPDPKNLALAASAGANGYMLKTLPPAQIVEALRSVMHGSTWIQPELMQQLYSEFANGPQADAAADVDLTPRQIEVLKLVAQGLRNSEIANHLTISEQTVKTHVAHLLEKLGVASRLQAARYAISKKLVDA